MPEMDGYEATQKIRQMESEQNLDPVRIIAMTAHAMQGDSELCMAAGMNDYLSKPVDPSQLIAVLKRAGIPTQATFADTTNFTSRLGVARIRSGLP